LRLGFLSSYKVFFLNNYLEKDDIDYYFSLHPKNDWNTPYDEDRYRHGRSKK
jgi:hypothetical protein